MIGDTNTFLHLTQVNGVYVVFGGKDKGRIISRDTIKVGELIIDDIALVKGLRHNLISINKLCDKGYEINFKDGICIGKAKYPSKTSSRKRYGNIYPLNVQSESTH